MKEFLIMRNGRPRNPLEQENVLDDLPKDLRELREREKSFDDESIRHHMKERMKVFEKFLNDLIAWLFSNREFAARRGEGSPLVLLLTLLFDILSNEGEFGRAVIDELRDKDIFDVDSEQARVKTTGIGVDIECDVKNKNGNTKRLRIHIINNILKEHQVKSTKKNQVKSDEDECIDIYVVLSLEKPKRSTKGRKKGDSYLIDISLLDLLIGILWPIRKSGFSSETTSKISSIIDVITRILTNYYRKRQIEEEMYYDMQRLFRDWGGDSRYHDYPWLIY